MLARLTEEILKSFRAPENLRASEWAEKHFYLSPESSTITGSWTNIPYQIVPLDAMGDDEIRTVTVIKSARWGYTKMQVIICGYFAQHKKRSGLFVQPTEDDVKGFVKDEIDPAIRDCEPMAQIFMGADKTNSPDNTNHRKLFLGGIHDFIGAHSPRGFRRKTKHLVSYDEVDGFELQAGKEGDQIKLGDKRMMSAPYPKSIRGSTPTTDGVSKIQKSFDDADMQLEYYVPCPECGHMEPIRFGNLKFDKTAPLAAKLECQSCKALIPYSKQAEMVRNGEWRTEEGLRVTNDYQFLDQNGNSIPKPEHIGFKSWCGISPFPDASWGRICKEFLDSKKDPLLLQTFVNTILGEPWKEKEKDKLKPDALKKRIEDYESLSEIPDGVLVVTAGVDVQADRFEIQLIGHGLSQERWVLAHKIEFCDTSIKSNYRKFIDSWLDITMTAKDGTELYVMATCIDTGYATQNVYDYVISHAENYGSRRLAIKGMSGKRKVIEKSTAKNWKAGLRGWIVGTDTTKDILAAHLKITEAGPGYIHFPSGLPSDYFEQLTAEVKTRYKSNGKHEYKWVCPDGKRNEAIDTMVYAEAAFESLNIDMLHLAKERQQQSRKISLKEIAHALNNH